MPAVSPTLRYLLACSLLALMAACGTARVNDASIEAHPASPPGARQLGGQLDRPVSAPAQPPASVSGMVLNAAQTAQADHLALQLPAHRVVLLGEVHDNGVGHAMRLRALSRALAAGWRPAIAMEQFDQENQASLTRALHECQDAGCVIARMSAGQTGWEWSYYEPLIALALRYHLPVFSANLSRSDAARVMKGGLGTVFSAEQMRELGLDKPIDATLLRTQEQEIKQGHCNMLPEHLHRGMAMAQIARDATMAEVMEQALLGGSPAVVLLAGNGHVRKRIGVPYWLFQQSAKPASWAVGFVESPAPAGNFDEEFIIPPAQRPDPCIVFRQGQSRTR